MRPQQLGIPLQPAEPFELRYFVPHSGVAPAIRISIETIDRLAKSLGSSTERPGGSTLPPVRLPFALLYFSGPPGSGKSHLARALHLYAEEQGIHPRQIAHFDFSWGTDCASGCPTVRVGSEVVSPRFLSRPDLVDELVSYFVTRYEELKANGGLFIAAEGPPESIMTENPHVRTRLLSGTHLRLSYPEEWELPALVERLLERHNLRISANKIRYLLARSPTDPLSLRAIVDRMDTLASCDSSGIGLRTIRSALGLPVETEKEPEDLSAADIEKSSAEFPLPDCDGSSPAERNSGQRTCAGLESAESNFAESNSAESHFAEFNPAGCDSAVGNSAATRAIRGQSDSTGPQPTDGSTVAACVSRSTSTGS